MQYIEISMNNVFWIADIQRDNRSVCLLTNIVDLIVRQKENRELAVKSVIDGWENEVECVAQVTKVLW